MNTDLTIDVKNRDKIKLKASALHEGMTRPADGRRVDQISIDESTARVEVLWSRAGFQSLVWKYGKNDLVEIFD